MFFFLQTETKLQAWKTIKCPTCDTSSLPTLHKMVQQPTQI